MEQKKKERATHLDVAGLQDGDGESIGRRVVAEGDVHLSQRTGRRRIAAQVLRDQLLPMPDGRSVSWDGVVSLSSQGIVCVDCDFNPT